MTFIPDKYEIDGLHSQESTGEKEAGHMHIRMANARCDKMKTKTGKIHTPLRKGANNASKRLYDLPAIQNR